MASRILKLTSSVRALPKATGLQVSVHRGECFVKFTDKSEKFGFSDYAIGFDFQLKEIDSNAS